MTQQAQAEALRLRLAVTQYTALCKKFGAEGFHFDPRPEDVIAVLDRLEQLEAQQAVPQGWTVTEEMHVAAIKVLQRANGLDGLPQRMLDAMLAAAPTPPALEREPLTEMEINELFDQNYSHDQPAGQYFVEIIRMAEQAHGIGVETK